MATTYKVEIPLETHMLQLRAVGFALGVLEGVRLNEGVPGDIRDLVETATERIESILQMADDYHLVSTPQSYPTPKENRMPNPIHLPIEEETLPDVLDAVADRMEHLEELWNAHDNSPGSIEDTEHWKQEYLRLEPIRKHLEDLVP